MTTDRTDRWRYPAVLPKIAIVLLGTVIACGGRAQSGNAVQARLIQEYVDAFKPHGMIAVLIPIGQEPGDVMDRLGEEFVHRRGECFPQLTARESPSRLPNLDLGVSTAVRLGLGLEQVGDTELKALGENQVLLRFDHVTVQTLSQGEMRQAIDRKACPEVASLIDKKPEALENGTLLLGEVFRARSIVRVSRAQGGGGSFSLSGLRALATRFGLALKAEGGGEIEAAQAIELSSAELVPVAFRPAFIRLDPSQPGYRAGEGRPGAPSIVPFNPESEADRLALNAWIDRNLPSAINGAR